MSKRDKNVVIKTIKNYDKKEQERMSPEVLKFLKDGGEVKQYETQPYELSERIR